MANTYFKFKQFTVEQDKCAMKVGTDGVLLGAWCDCDNVSNVLDVGTGTGLISLMLAQRSDAKITAIEIDVAASEQAQQNIEESPWGERIQVFNSSLQDFQKTSKDKYDLIVCNPPFFNNSLKSPIDQRTIARHSDTLTGTDLLKGAYELLSPSGRLVVVLPYVEGCVLVADAVAHGLYCVRKMNVHPTPTKEIKRLLLEFSFQMKPCVEESLIIEDKGRHKYSDKYYQLTKDYYL